MEPANIVVIILVGLVVLGFIYFNIIFPMKANKKEAQDNNTKDEVITEEKAEKDKDLQTEKTDEVKAEIKNVTSKKKQQKKSKKVS